MYKYYICRSTYVGVDPLIYRQRGMDLPEFYIHKGLWQPSSFTAFTALDGCDRLSDAEAFAEML